MYTNTARRQCICIYSIQHTIDFIIYACLQHYYSIYYCSIVISKEPYKYSYNTNTIVYISNRLVIFLLVLF